MRDRRWIACLALLLVMTISAASAYAQGSQVARQEGNTFTFSLIGDCTVGDQYKYRGYKSSFTYKITEKGLHYPFELAAHLFAADDLTLANCEGVFTTRKLGANGKFMALSADPSFAKVFRLGHVDVCNTANNHIRDFGGQGRRDTFDALAAVGIGAFGDDDLYTTTVKGVKIGFVGYTYPITEAKLQKYKKHIDALKDDGCHFVVASAHWGKEESLKINAQQRQGAPALIDMGADLVYGHGSHTVQPIQVYKGKLIFYSLSNFTFGANAAPKDDDTVVISLTYTIGADGTLSPKEMTAYPYKMHQDKDFRPCPIEEEAGKQRVYQKLVFSGKRDPISGLPASFLTTGYVDFTKMDFSTEP